MKKTIIATTLAFAMTSSASFAAVNQAETTFLFGSEAVEMQTISATEMAATEGQLFGISSEVVSKYIAVAATALAPVLQGLSKSIGEGITDGITNSITNTTTFRDPAGSPTAAKIGEGFLDGIQASLGSTFSLSNLLSGFNLFSFL